MQAQCSADWLAAFSDAVADGSVAAQPDAYGGIGLFVTSDRAAGGVISSIALHKCLCVRDTGVAPHHYRSACPVDVAQVHSRWQEHWNLALPPPLLQLLNDTRTDQIVRLAAWLAWLQTAAPGGSPWRAWARSLPPPAALPLLRTLSADEAHALHFRHLIAAAQRDAAAHSAQRAAIANNAALSAFWRAADDGADDAAFERRFDWTIALVSSRSFALVTRDGVKLACMAPVHDAANHDPARRNTRFDLVDGPAGPSHVYAATAALARGAEALVCYGGEKSNAVLLSAYGFVLEGNLADRAELGARGRWTGFANFEADAARWLDRSAWRALRRMGLDVSGGGADEAADGARDDGAVEVRLDGSSLGAPHRRALAAAVSVMEALDFECSSPTVLRAGPQDPSLTELLVLRLERVMGRISVLAEQSATTTADDLNLIRSTPFSGMHTAVLARVEFKLLLRACVEFCSALRGGWCDCAGDFSQGNSFRPSVCVVYSDA